MKGYEELVQILKMIQATNGMDISNEAAIEYQDMIGHSSEEQLEELANGNYKEAFYRVYGVAYGTIEAIKFHCKHGQKIREILETNADQQAEIDRLNYIIGEKDKTIDKKQEIAEKFQQGYEQSINEAKAAEARIKELEAQMQELKAKLYDLMTA